LFLVRPSSTSTANRHDQDSTNHESPPKWIQKLSKSDTSFFGIGNLGNTYNDIVEFVDDDNTVVVDPSNGTNNMYPTETKTTNVSITYMTRRERVERLSGIVHWQKEIYRNQEQHLDISCMEHLYMTHNRKTTPI